MAAQPIRSRRHGRVAVVVAALVLVLCALWLPQRENGPTGADSSDPRASGSAGHLAAPPPRASRRAASAHAILADDGVATGEAAEALEAAAWLVVHATWEDDGSPLRGAHVRAQVVDVADGLADGPRDLETGEDGSVRVGPFPAGTRRSVRLTVSCDDASIPTRSEYVLLARPPAEAHHRLTFVRRGSLRGTVEWPDGSPAPGVAVHLMSVYEAGRAETGPQGEFEIGGLRRGLYRVRVVVEREDARYEGTTEGEVGGAPAVLRLEERRRRLRVRVLDPAGLPVHRAVVWWAGTRVVDKETPVEDGVATLWRPLGGEPEVGRIVARRELPADRPHDGARYAIASPVDRDAHVVDVVFGPGSRVEGTVVTPDGTPMPEVAVHTVGRVEVPGGGYGPLLRNRTTTDDRGVFRLSGLVPGTYHLRAGPHDVWRESGLVRAETGDTRVRLVLRAATSRDVLVLRPDGAPAARAVIRWSAQVPGERDASVTAYTDDAGVAHLWDLPAEVDGNLWVNPESKFGALDAHVPDSRAGRITVRLEPSFQVSGRVVDTAGRPVAGATVEAIASGRHVRDRTEEDGRFRLANLRAGTVALWVGDGAPEKDPDADSASARAVPGDAVRVEAGAEDVRLVVDTGGELTVRVANWPDRAVRPAAVLIEGDEWMPGARVIGPYEWAGTWRFRGLRRDRRYVLWMRPDHDGDLCLWKPGLTAGTSHDVRLAPGASIAGSLTLPARAYDWWANIRIAGLNVDGRLDGPDRYAIRGLPEGTWTIEAGAWLPLERRSEIEVRATTGAADVDLRWPE